jgi:Ca2+-binding EF-hand superfamily protein
MPDREAMMANAGKRAYHELLLQLDKDQDGKLSKAEFMAMTRDPSAAEAKYKTWDVDADGYITEEEYLSVIQNITVKRPGRN